MRFLT